MSAGDEAARARRAGEVWRRLVSTPAGLIGLCLTALVVGMALFADVIAPHDPFALVGPPLRGPSAEHLMGTDDLGRDVFSGVVHGARASLLLGLGVAGMVAVIGVVVGMVSGYYGMTIDDVLMRITEAFQVLPRFFLAIVVIALFGAGIDRIIAVLGVTSWAIVARVVRAETLSAREQEYIEAARALGAGDLRILLSHILPGVLPSTVTFVTLMVAQAILVEASLGFLGLSDPSVMSWGILAGNAQKFLRVAWWLAVFPGAAIAVAVLGINLLGDGLTEAFGTGASATERAATATAEGPGPGPESEEPERAHAAA